MIFSAKLIAYAERLYLAIIREGLNNTIEISRKPVRPTSEENSKSPTNPFYLLLRIFQFHEVINFQ